MAAGEKEDGLEQVTKRRTGRNQQQTGGCAGAIDKEEDRSMMMRKTSWGRRRRLWEDGPRWLMTRKWMHRGKQVTRTGDGNEEYDGTGGLTMRRKMFWGGSER